MSLPSAAMHLMSLDNVAASVEGRTLFTGASFGLTSDDRVGLVGPNGSGKTTLLRIIAGERPPDAGSVVPRSGLRIGMLSQQPRLTDERALDVVLAGDPTAAPHEAERLLDVVGIDPEQSTARMSGGQRRRVAVAQTLLAPSDLLILDEPTNHLDVDTIDWLEDELRRRASGLVLVTHDRYVLERLANRMLDLADAGTSGTERPRQVHWHEGSYSSLLEARAERAASRERSTARARNLLRKEVAWLRRGPKARSSKPRFRVEQVEVLRDAAAGDLEAKPLDLGTGRTRLGNDVLDLREVTVRRGEHTVLDRVDLGIGPGERVGIVGPNGAGKTTLLHVLTGRLAPDAGEVRVGTTVELALYEQELRAPGPAGPTSAGSSAGDENRTVLDTVLDIAPFVPLANGETLPAHRLAERFGFDGQLQRTPLERLSGGERRRVALLHLLVAAPNVLVLDEPTNDLDLDTLTVLEDHLDGFRGTLVVASHDRYVLDRLTDRIVAVEHGRLTEHLDWESYRNEHRLRTRAAADRAAAEAAAPTASAQDNKARQAARKEARRLEQQVERLGARRDRLHADMAAAATDVARLGRLQAELHQVEGELTAAEDRWLELTVD
ncbi:ABC-F family ATP-binding cassette domain-containing protein [Egicoccus halophilus]|uniref:ABC transporter ATP-binding protein n=1 Tax=Egicoccus halophilus TaxID=1670830 RepID=A0A8J3ETG4_9ACTN|nr:ABC-F family ATP-binding cassette domain-containing protein [Egicoccus halophilus]GGI09555.1 ABC transporter ATP-binding protein [Egicoccus halophilus]